MVSGEPFTVTNNAWIHVNCTEDLRRRADKAAAHVGISRSELVRLALAKYMQDRDLWSLRGPSRTSGKQRNPKTSKHAMREEVEIHDE